MQRYRVILWHNDEMMRDETISLPDKTRYFTISANHVGGSMDARYPDVIRIEMQRLDNDLD